MAQPVLSVRMEAEVKQQFISLCDELGMSASVAVNIFAKQAIRERGLPFAVTTVSSKGSLALGDIKNAVTNAARQHGSVESVTLFGSYARGDANADSDIDLRLVYAEDGNFSLVDLSSFVAVVEEATGREVDVVSKRHLDDTAISRAIEKEGVVLYERKGE